MSGVYVVGITGASGAVYARRLLERLLEAEAEVHVAISPSGADVWRQELRQTLNPRSPDPALLVPGVSAELRERLHAHSYDDYFAPIASGSFLNDGMTICPCSGQTLSAVAHSMAGNLIQRAAEVQLKERRRLVLVTRETPLSLGQIENMGRAVSHGAVVMPASPGWYHGVQSLDDLIDFIVARILDQLGVDNRMIRRWGEPEAP